jgi:amino acid transporter
MNLAQKNAWFGLIGSLFSIPVFGPVGYALWTGFAPNKCWILKGISGLAAVFAIFFVVVNIIVIRVHKKRTNEPETDERDRQISLHAIRVCLISLCLLIYFSDAAIMLYTGSEGWILSSVLPLIHFGMGYIALTVYFATIIILQGKNIKEAEEETK